MKTLYVYYKDEQLGTLSVEESNQYVFCYNKQWLKSDTAFSISCSLPLIEGRQSHQASYTFFSNLIPEGDLRDKLAKQLGLSVKNDFGLLEVIGGDVAGAISLYSDTGINRYSETENKISSKLEHNKNYQVKVLNETDLLFILEKLKTHPFLVNTDDLNQGKKMRLSLAGAQNKLPIIYEASTPQNSGENKHFALPLGQTASTHILKPDNEHIKGLAINEAFCMKLAKACGLIVAEVELMQIQEKLILLIKRYDRKNRERLHQEDFCQALAIVPFNKYESEGGPSIGDCRQIIDRFSQRPAVDKKRLLQWTIFNYLIGNADAHGKNISLLYQPSPVLAPFYDLLCTAIYPSLTDKLSMKIGGENRPDWIMKRHWLRHCEVLGISEKLLQREAKKLILDVQKKAKKILISNTFSGYGYENSPLSKIMELIENRANTLKKRLGSD